MNRFFRQSFCSQVLNRLTVGLILLFGLGSFSASDRSLDLTVDVETANTDAGAARRELLDAAAKKAIEDYLRSEFGDGAINSRRAVVDSKILNEFSKYVPSSRSLEFAAIPNGGHKALVLVKLNRTDLMSRAFAVGLRRPSELEPIVLPLWLWVDETQSSIYGWWASPEQSPNVWLQLMSQSWETQASMFFGKQGLQFLRPQNGKFVTQVAQGQRAFKLEEDDAESLANTWRAPLVMTGFVRVHPLEGTETKLQVQVNLTVKFIKSQRVVAQIQRNFPIEEGPVQVVVDRKLKEIRDSLLSELAEQVGESRRKGTLQATSVQFEFVGLQEPVQREMLKSHLAQKYRGIKEVRETSIEARKTVFAVDVVQDLAEMAKELKEFRVGDLMVRLEDRGSERLSFKVESAKGAK